MVKKVKQNTKLIIISCTLLLLIIIKVSATSNFVTIAPNDNATFDLIDNGDQGGKRDIQIGLTNIAAGKRLNSIDYCLKSSDCNDDSNWNDVTAYDSTNIVSDMVNGVGSATISLFLKIPVEELNLKINFEDYEPMNISYAKYNLETTNESEYRDIYVDKINDINNYDTNYTNIATGFIGGDIILPNGCTNNGCILKVAFAENDYNDIIDRLNYYNEHYNDEEDKLFLDLSSMFNHLSGDDLATDTIKYLERNNKLYIENSNGEVSFYLIVNKFFSQTNRSNFSIVGNNNRILSEDYIGLNYTVDRKYFDEGNNYGFLTFNQFNNYEQEATIFYGTPLIKFDIDRVIEPALVTGGNANGMGTIKHPYNKIVSGDQDRFPINNSYELTINSFYEPDYIVPIVLKNNDEVVQNISLNLKRFAFGGNAGGLLLVDNNGINCRRANEHPNCTEDNIYVSTNYRGLYDTFYSNGESSLINTFMISNQREGIRGDERNNEKVYLRNEDFNPWAVAIFYRDDEVIATRSFDLGTLVKVEGYSTDVITNDMVNNVAKNYNNELITDYDSSQYTIFGYGLGYEKSINRIKYFPERTYLERNIDYPLILASKKEILDNNINRIALFLTNGELKSNEDKFPELTYGVGEGKIFEIDGRVFEELGGGE